MSSCQIKSPPVSLQDVAYTATLEIGKHSANQAKVKAKAMMRAWKRDAKCVLCSCQLSLVITCRNNVSESSVTTCSQSLGPMPEMHNRLKK